MELDRLSLLVTHEVEDYFFNNAVRQQRYVLLSPFGAFLEYYWDLMCSFRLLLSIMIVCFVINVVPVYGPMYTWVG